MRMDPHLWLVGGAHKTAYSCRRQSEFQWNLMQEIQSINIRRRKEFSSEAVDERARTPVRSVQP